MPIYEYQCQACGHRMEAMQKMSDPLLSECPECKKPELKKLMSAGSFTFKEKAAVGCQPGACGSGACPASRL